MNRILRNDGTWHKRNGPKGTGISWLWDYLNEQLLDTYNLSSDLIGFQYTPAGNVPEGAYNDNYNVNVSLTDFLYNPGALPNGPTDDNFNINTAVMEFTYTTDGNIPNGSYDDTLTINISVENFSYS